MGENPAARSSETAESSAMLWCQVSIMLAIQEDDHTTYSKFLQSAAPRPQSHPSSSTCPAKGGCVHRSTVSLGTGTVSWWAMSTALNVKYPSQIGGKMRHALTGARDSSLPCQVSSSAWVAKCSNLRAPKLDEWRSAADWINKGRVAHTSGNVANRYASNV